MFRDVHRFKRRLRKITDGGKPPVSDHLDQDRLIQLQKDVAASLAQVEARSRARPVTSYSDDLPIAQKRELIMETIRDHQVTILCGETGSGKTTQLPKLCLDVGLGIRGKVGHTQPRRLAARSVAQRIAEELNCELGQEVGYKVRFSDQSDDQSYIKLMTDGILLAECHHDPFLNQYDTIIIDEAHERSLNIDFLLGYIRRLVKKRKDLKVIITSATIDPERFSKHFDDAPIINVSGRTYPVEVRYRPFDKLDDDKKDMFDAIVDAVFELSKVGRGDILVFLSGERDIRDADEALSKVSDHRLMSNTEVLPLLARLSASEQNRIFHTSSKRKIVLATNVAETSLTVPGIRYVIDTGLARISRYSWRSKIQRLPIERISQASANQRKGRCGRVADGICIRLYDEDEFNQRDEFTEPEIRRTNLASVILQMEHLGLGHVDDFPFVEPPENRLINDGYQLLYELHAINEHRKITAAGRKLARLPIDPRLARMLLEAERHQALREVLIIVSAMAIQDVRERPLDKQQAADQKHAVFNDKASDFLFYINLWQAFHDQKAELSNNQLRKWCKKNFISWLRMREWMDTRRQIKSMLKEQGYSLNTRPASVEQIHRCLLVGLLSNIGLKDEDRQFTGARNRKFMIFPGSVMAKKSPNWIMSAEIVETTQVYARCNAKIDPVWIEQSAGHLLKHHYANPHWEKKRGQVIAHQQSTLYGLIVIPDRKMNYARVAPEQAREIFIRSALVNGELETRLPFYKHNQQIYQALENQQAKTRRLDIIVDDDVLYDFYDQHIPAHVVGQASLEKWIKQHPDQQKQLYLSEQQLTRSDAASVSSDLFPDLLEIEGSRYPLEYHFDPRNHCDGITMIVPLALLATLNPQRCEWLIPGMIEEKMTALIRSLPKAIRKNFVPAPDFARACVQALNASDTSLTVALANELKRMTGVQIPFDAWRYENVSPHLFMNFRIIDAAQNILAEGRNLQQLKDELIDGEIPVIAQRAKVTHVDEQEPGKIHALERDDVGPDALDQLDQAVELDVQGVKVTAYPALVTERKDGRVNLRVVPGRQQADTETEISMVQLFINAQRDPIKHIQKSLPGLDDLCLKYSEFGRCESLKNALVRQAVKTLFLKEPVKTENEFNRRLEIHRSELYPEVEKLCKLLTRIMQKYRSIKKQVNKPALHQLDMVADIQQQLAALFKKDFIETVDMEWLLEYPRYLEGIEKRLQKSDSDANRDRQYRLEFARLWQQYEQRLQELEREHIVSRQLEHYRWMLEEYRVSLFAQPLKTRFPVSEKRLKAYWNNMTES